MSWLGCDNIPGWNIAAKLADVIRLCSDLDANTARRSRIYRSSWRFNGGSSVINRW